MANRHFGAQSAHTAEWAEPMAQPWVFPRSHGIASRASRAGLKQRIYGKLVDQLDLARVGELEGDVLRREIRLAVEQLCDREATLLSRAERERLVKEVLDETFGVDPRG